MSTHVLLIADITIVASALVLLVPGLPREAAFMIIGTFVGGALAACRRHG
jgi:hypothetical protein